MICKSPLFRIDVLKQPGLAARVERVPDLCRANGGIIASGDRFAALGLNLIDLTPLPCGQCISCRLNYGRTWAVRMMCESEYHEHNYFITLTYDDRFLPSELCYDLSTNTVKDSSLRPKDFTNYMKRQRELFRREFGVSDVSFYGCGEYGDLADRPHYHICLFGCPDLSSDFRFLKQDGGIIHWTCDAIADAWRDPGSHVSLGFHSISEFNYETAAYTGRYMTKKVKGLAGKIENVDPELMDLCSGNIRYNSFSRMSRRPGLGYQYFKDHSFDILRTDSIAYQKDHKSFLAKSPRYFDRLFDLESPSLLDGNRELRRELGNAQFVGMSNSERLRFHSRQGEIAEINAAEKVGSL